MTSQNDATRKNVGFFAAAFALPATIVRRLLHIPVAIVDVMERHGTEK